MANRLRTTSALAVVAMFLVGACASSSTSPPPHGRGTERAARAQPRAHGRIGRRRAHPPRRPRRLPGGSRADRPDRLHRAGQGTDKGADGKLPFAGKTVSIQTQWIGGEGTNFAASVADFAKATGINVQIDSIGSSHETVLKTPHRGRQAAGPGACSPSRRPSWPMRPRARSSTSPRSWMPRSSATEHPATIGLVTQGDKIWGIPYKADVKSTIWYPIKAFAAKGYTGPEDVGRADRPVRQDRRRRLQPVVRQRRRPRRRDRLAAHRLGRGSGPQDQGPRLLQRLDQPQGHVRGPGHQGCLRQGRQDLLHAELRLRRQHGDRHTRTRRRPWTRCSTDDLAHPKCWMQKIPTWYGPDFFPDQRASGQPSKYIVGTDVGIFAVPDHRPGAEQRRGLGRHAHGARRPARSSCRCRVPRHAGRPPELDPRRQRHLDQHHHPRRLVCRRLQAQGRFRDREQRCRASASTLPTSCPARSAPEPSGPRWTTGSTTAAPIPMPTLKAIDDSWPAS